MFNTKLIIISSILVTLSACGSKENAKTEESSKKNTQVVAKVNGDEISVHQLNFALGRVAQGRQLDQAQTKQASEQVLTRLVDQQLLVQKAVDLKLDRDPKVLQALEASKAEILAQVYLEQVLAKAEKPSSTKIDTFYKENPELFEKRRVFRLQELVVEVDSAKQAEVQDAVKNMKSINDIANYFKSNKYEFNANSNVRAAEQLPIELLKKIQPLKDGEFVAVPSGRVLNIVHLAASQFKPIARDKAAPVIEQYFLNQSKSAVAKAEMADLKQKAKIEFVGAFSEMKINDSVTSKASIKTEPDAKKPEASQPVPAQTSTNADVANMVKGL